MSSEWTTSNITRSTLASPVLGLERGIAKGGSIRAVDRGLSTVGTTALRPLPSSGLLVGVIRTAEEPWTYQDRTSRTWDFSPTSERSGDAKRP